MTRPLLDTAPEAAARYREMLLARSPSDRIVMACGLFDTARATVLASLGNESDVVTRRVHLFTRTYGRDFDAATVRRIIDRLRELPACVGLHPERSEDG